MLSKPVRQNSKRFFSVKSSWSSSFELRVKVNVDYLQSVMSAPKKKKKNNNRFSFYLCLCINGLSSVVKAERQSQKDLSPLF